MLGRALGFIKVQNSLETYYLRGKKLLTLAVKSVKYMLVNKTRGLSLRLSNPRTITWSQQKLTVRFITCLCFMRKKDPALEMFLRGFSLI